jgi:hypothetical protein
MYLAYKIANAAATLKAGGTIQMTATVTGTGDSPAIPLNPTYTIDVARSAKSTDIKVNPEAGGQVYIATAGGSTSFVTKDPSTYQGTSAYLSESEVQIGYIKINQSQASDMSGVKFYGITDKDTATLTITDGQFAASPGGVGATGKPYILAGGTIDATFPLADATTASWTLTSANLQAIADVSPVDYPNGAPIIVRVDGTNEINVEETEPEASMTLTLGSLTPVGTVEIPATTLRRIPYDGKVCWVYNVPSPGDNVADLLSIRITNDTRYPGAINGTLYPEAGGTPDFENVNLLSSILADTADPRSQVLSLDGTDAVLAPGATIRLSADDISKVAGNTWAGERKVLRIQSELSDLEVMTLLRYAVDSTKQPQSNVSTGVTGNSCTPK